MHKSKIFLVGDENGNLVELEETDYVKESTLQKLLADYPDLLPGDQIDPENPRRWLMVAREMGVPGSESETGRWSLDHLFLDQEGVPTFVECKRAADTRSRREVVAQMLDYAANGVKYWGMDRLRQAAAETAQSRGASLDDEIVRLLGDEKVIDVEEYWESVETNLRNRRVRLVFVADSTPAELRRLVEFLNEEMVNVEVLAVEVKQFQGAGRNSQKALVPRVVGLTEAARSAKKSSSRRKNRVTREEFMSKSSPEIREFFQKVLDLASERGHVIYWGEAGFSIRAQLPNGQLATFAYGFPPNQFQFYFAYEDLIPAGETSAILRHQLLDFGVFQESGKWTLKTFVTEDNLELMDEIYNFILAQIDGLLETRQG